MFLRNITLILNFFGGGAVLFALQPKKALINDLNGDLIKTYIVIKDSPEDLIKNLSIHENTSEYFYKIRNEDLKKLFEQALKQIALLMGRNDLENLASIIYQPDYQKALKKQVNAILDVLHSNGYLRIIDYLKDCYENGFLGTMYDLHGQGIPLMLQLNQEQVLNALTTDSKLSKPLYERLGEDIKVLKRKVSSEISIGIANNFSYTEIAKNLRGVSNVGMNNAYRIARTEDHRIQKQSSMDAANKDKENGADVVKQWGATLDSRARPHHAQLNGQIRGTRQTI